MGRMILDTSVLVAGRRGSIDPESAGFGSGHDVSVPAIAVAEFLGGALRAAQPTRNEADRAFLEMILDVLPVSDYTLDVAEHHAALIAHTATIGRRRGAHDLIVAATARATKRTIVTLDARARFDDLPGVEVTVLSAK